MARRGKRMSGEGQIEARLSALRQDLEALQEDMRGLGEGVGEAAQERLTEALRATEALAAQAQDWGNENLETVRDSIREIRQAWEDQVHRSLKKEEKREEKREKRAEPKSPPRPINQ